MSWILHLTLARIGGQPFPVSALSCAVREARGLSQWSDSLQRRVRVLAVLQVLESVVGGSLEPGVQVSSVDSADSGLCKVHVMSLKSRLLRARGVVSYATILA
jgi:hypothetical protein